MTTTDNEPEPLPPAWQAALVRFRDGYGDEFDPTDRGDIWCLVQLLEEEVHDRITRDLVKSFREATARIQEQGRVWEEQRREQQRQ
jgi:hypothetical protein